MRSPTTPSRRSTCSTTRSKPITDLEDALSDRVIVHAELGTNSSYTWNLLVEETDGAVQRAFDAAAYTVSERYVQQRLHADGDGAACGGGDAPAVRRRHDAVHLDADPARPQGDGRRSRSACPSTRCAWSPRPSVAGSAPSSTCTPRNCCASRSPASTACRCAGTKTRSENTVATIHGPRPDPAHGARRRRRRHGSPPCASASPPTWARTCSSITPGHPAARRVPVRRGLRPAQGVRLLVHRRCSPPDPDRRLPRCRPARSHVRHRAGDGLARSGRWASIRSSSGAATSSARTSSPTRRSPGSSTTRATTTRPPSTPRN